MKKNKLWIGGKVLEGAVWSQTTLCSGTAYEDKTGHQGWTKKKDQSNKIQLRSVSLKTEQQ